MKIFINGLIISLAICFLTLTICLIFYIHKKINKFFRKNIKNTKALDITENVFYMLVSGFLLSVMFEYKII